jgi:hypothetical protein
MNTLNLLLLSIIGKYRRFKFKSVDEWEIQRLVQRSCVSGLEEQWSFLRKQFKVVVSTFYSFLEENLAIFCEMHCSSNRPRVFSEVCYRFTIVALGLKVVILFEYLVEKSSQHRPPSSKGGLEVDAN